MNLPSILKHKTLQFSALALLLPLIGSILMINQQHISSQQFFPEPTATPLNYLEATNEVTDDLRERYSPAHFGIPDTIAGYPVLAVLSAENTECMPDWELRLQFQTTETSREDYLASETGQKIQQAVDALGISGATISVSGPGSSLESLIRENERWNEGMRAGGCIKSGGPIMLTPSPVDPAEIATLAAIDVNLGKYLPSFFRLPDTVAGYELLAVLDEESTTTRCYIPGMMHLLVRAKGAVDDEYYSGNHRMIGLELEQNSGRQVVIEFVERYTTEADLIQIIAGQIQRLQAKGCSTIKFGPMPDPIFPTPTGD
ncbi:MAG: hypothetical protein H7X77_11050 [Anaerolineae bacterium]|nr:hypothetical protein [Anaerolineae bacterium]